MAPDAVLNVAKDLLEKSSRFKVFSASIYDLLNRANAFTVQIGAEQLQHSLTPGDVLTMVEVLGGNPNRTLRQFQEEIQLLFPARLSAECCTALVNLGVHAMIMIDSTAKDWHAPEFSLGNYKPTSWLPNQSLTEFVETCIPGDLDVESERIATILAQKSALKAWKLQKRLGIAIRGTDNLAKHLVYDPRGNVLYLFHHVAFLKAHLTAWSARPGPSDDVSVSLQLGTLPRQLLLETVHSLQSVLFPPSDGKSVRLLQQLVKKRGFDAELSDYTRYTVPSSQTNDFQYKFWGERLSTLYHLLEDRPPRNSLEKWFRWQTSETNALFIALLALLISIIVGVVSIIIGILQLWISWVAWKRPLSAA